MGLAQFIELLTIYLLWTIFLFSPLVTLFTIFLLSWFWSLSMTATLCFIYGCWIYFDRYTDSQGGRWSDWFRRLPIIKPFVNYFPIKLIKTEDLDPNRNYIFGFHPHGAFSFGALGNFATDATHFSSLFPNIRPHLMLLHLQFLFPFTREILLKLGACCVSKESCEYFLSGKSGQGHALVIIIGGAREMYLTKNDTMKLYLKARQGFVRLALQHGTSYFIWRKRALYTTCLFQFDSQWFTMGPIHLRACTTSTSCNYFGKPIHVTQNTDPTSEDIDRLHIAYVQAVEQLFEINKNNYKLGHVKLEIV
ncbi:unnamed protein product [Rotaria socialis]